MPTQYAILSDITPNRATVAFIGSMEDVYNEAEKMGGRSSAAK